MSIASRNSWVLSDVVCQQTARGFIIPAPVGGSTSRPGLVFWGCQLAGIFVGLHFIAGRPANRGALFYWWHWIEISGEFPQDGHARLPDGDDF